MKFYFNKIEKNNNKIIYIIIKTIYIFKKNYNGKRRRH